MIARYTLPEMGKIWSDEYRYQTMLEIEILVCEAWARQGKIPAAALAQIKKKAKVSKSRIDQIEAKVHHDLIAFLTNLAENVGRPSRYIHLGLTSSDVLDTSLAVQMREAADLLIKKAEGLKNVLGAQARRYRDTPCIARTHGVHAEPTTFGLKLALHFAEAKRNIERLKNARSAISFGKISGAVGTYAHLPLAIEKYVCRKLNLKPDEISTQIVQRDRHAEFLSTLALVGASLEKLALEIRNLQRTEIREAEEPFARGQKGSSAMPHKRNPIICERVSGLARILRANGLAALENVSLWHERDISHSSVERVIIPDSAILLDYMLAKMEAVVRGLAVYPENMKKNLEKTRGLIFSQKALLTLVDKGLSREDAYRIVQGASFQVLGDRKEKTTLKETLARIPKVRKLFSEKELDNIFSITPYLAGVKAIFQRLRL